MPFNGNPNLRARDDEFTYTSDHLNELRKCSEDPIYFIKNYIKYEGTNYDMYDFQEKLVSAFERNRFNIVKHSNEVGISHATIAYVVWYSLFHGHKTIALLDKALYQAQHSLHVFKTMYSELPLWIQPGVEDWNKRGVRLSNGTRLVCAHTSPCGIKGMAVNLMVISSFAHLPTHYADEFIACVFPIMTCSKTTRMIIESIPSGDNHFKHIWDAASYEGEYKMDSNGFIKHSIPYFVVDGRDDEWKDNMIPKIGNIIFKQQYLCEFIGESE